MPFDSSPAPITVADILDRAAELIETHGWCRGQSWDAEGRFCMLGAIGRAVDETFPMRRERTWEAVRALGRVFPQDDMIHIERPAMMWNDTVCQSKAEAIAKLREARDMNMGENLHAVR